MSKKKWTEDEEIYLEYYLYDDDDKEHNYDSASDFLKTTNKKLINKANKMRKKNKDIGYINKPFSEYELDYIKKNYLMVSTELMSDHLGRTRDVIIWKANQIGVTKLKQLKNYDAEIRELAQKGHYKAEIARMLGLNSKSVGDYINRNQINCKRAPKEASQKYFRDDEKVRHFNMTNRYHDDNNVFIPK